jgi:HAD superfamily hydrolase (TIGR01458 family)
MKALLVDLDGVIYRGMQIIPGAAEAIRWMTAEQIPHLFLTNTTSRPRQAIIDTLVSIGADVQQQDVLTPPVAAVQWLRQHERGRVRLVVPEATAGDFRGVELSSDDNDAIVSAVVIGDIGKDWTFERLNHVFRLLMRDQAPVMVELGMTRYWRADYGLRLDVGPYIKALEYATGKKAIVMGKPSVDFFNTALSILEVDPSQAVMIGDDIIGDVNGAQKAGIKGVLVKTGKFRSQDLQHEPKPDAVLDSIADLPQWWSEQLV